MGRHGALIFDLPWGFRNGDISHCLRPLPAAFQLPDNFDQVVCRLRVWCPPRPAVGDCALDLELRAVAQAGWSGHNFCKRLMVDFLLTCRSCLARRWLRLYGNPEPYDLLGAGFDSAKTSGLPRSPLTFRH